MNLLLAMLLGCQTKTPATDSGGGADSSCTASYGYAYPDGDGVGAGTVLDVCVPPLGYVSQGDDCDDADPTRTPGAPEVWYDGFDSDCNGLSPCGLQGTVYQSAADYRVTADVQGNYGYHFAYAGDGNGDGIGEVLAADCAGPDVTSVPPVAYYLVQLPNPTGPVDPTNLLVSDITVATFTVQDHDHQWEPIAGNVGTPPYLADVDFDQDGYPDYLIATMDGNELGPLSRLDLWYGPAVGDIDLDDALTVRSDRPCWFLG